MPGEELQAPLRRILLGKMLGVSIFERLYNACFLLPSFSEVSPQAPVSQTRRLFDTSTVPVLFHIGRLDK